MVISDWLSITYKNLFEITDFMGVLMGSKDISRRLDYRVSGKKHRKINNFRIIGQGK